MRNTSTLVSTPDTNDVYHVGACRVCLAVERTHLVGHVKRGLSDAPTLVSTLDTLDVDHVDAGLVDFAVERTHLVGNVKRRLSDAPWMRAVCLFPRLLWGFRSHEKLELVSSL